MKSRITARPCRLGPIVVTAGLALVAAGGTPAANLSGVYAEITQIAQATGHAQAAVRVTSDIRRQVAAIVRSVPRPKKPFTVYHELDQHYYSATSHTFIGQMYKLLGLVNIAD